MRVTDRKREIPDSLELPGLGGRVINLEHPEGAEQVRASPRQRVKPRAQDDVLGEGASSQPVLGVPAASADSRAGLADDLAREQQIQPLT